MVAYSKRIGLRYGKGISIGTTRIGTTPLGGLFDQTKWEDPAGAFGFNALGFNDSEFNDYGDPFDLTTDRVFSGSYRIEVRDKDGELLDKLPNFFDSQWMDKVNEPGSLSFSYMNDQDEAANLEYPNLIYLYRGTELYPERVFIIQSKKIRETEGDIATVECEGVIAQLARENIDSYNSGESTKTVYEILTEILADHQQLSNKFNLGYIDPSIGNSEIVFSLEKKSIYQALTELQSLFAGFVYSTPQRRLVWRKQIGSDEGHIIRFGKNATEIEETIDYRTIETRLHATADLYSGGTASVTVNDTTAQATYGIIEGYFKSIPVASVSELTTLATAELARRATPKKDYKVSAVDLSQTDKFDFSFEALALDPGSFVKLISDASGKEYEVVVFAVSRDIGNPLNVQIQPVDKNSDLADGSERGGVTTADAVLKLIEYVTRQERS